MSPIELWALRHHVGADALAELRMLTAEPPPTDTGADHASEAYAQSQVRLEAARKGKHLWRNNVGVLKDDRGVPVRFGLANDSKAMNGVIKSGDLIGIQPVFITPQMVGGTIGQFLSRECKRADWRWTGTPREVAQQNWNMLILAHGGDAGFATGPGTL